MIKVRNISGPRLADVELALEKVSEAVNVVGVNYVGSTWYIHFTIDQLAPKKIKTKIEVTSGTTSMETSTQ